MSVQKVLHVQEDRKIEFHFISLKNLTTDMKIIKTDIKTGQLTPVEIVVFAEQSLTLEMPKFSCALENSVALSVDIHIGKDKEHFEATGNVVHIENLKDHLHAEIKFRKFNSQAWSRVLGEFEKLQDEITKLFQSIKGQI